MQTRNLLFIAIALASLPALLLAQTQDWVQVSTRNSDVQLKLPPSYLVVENSPDFQKRLEELKKNNPDLAKRMGDSTNTVYDLTATDTAAATGDNMNVRITPSGGVQVSQYRLLGREILKNAPFNGKGKQEEINLPIGKTLHYFGDAKIKQPDGTDIEMYVSGYACIKGDKLYLFTFIAKSEAGKELQKKIDLVMKSVVIVK